MLTTMPSVRTVVSGGELEVVTMRKGCKVSRATLHTIACMQRLRLGSTPKVMSFGRWVREEMHGDVSEVAVSLQGYSLEVAWLSRNGDEAEVVGDSRTHVSEVELLR